MPNSESPVIDADGHVLMEAAEGWLDYFERADAEHMEDLIINNRRHWQQREGVDKEAVYDAIRQRNKGEGGWDAKARLAVMDAEGVDVAVLFGTELGLNQEAYSPSVCRGYNDWLADYCAADPKRLKGVALLPLDDIDASRAELERVVERSGFVGFFMKASVRGWSCDHRRYDPLYAAAEGLGVPSLIHIPHGVKDLLEQNFDYGFLRTHVVHSFAGMLACMDAVYGGLLDRFPRLRMAFLESQVGWLPWFVDRLDEQHATYSVRPGLETGLRRVPSTYLDEGRLFFSCDPDERYLAMAAEAQLAPGVAGEDCILWASDYPHSDAIYPGALRALTERDDLSETQKRKLTRENAQRLYAF